MSQFARPNSDITTGNWTISPLWSKIDEVIPDDADYIVHASTTQSDAKISLSNVTDPQIHTGHIVRHRALKIGGGTPVYIVSLYQGTTLIASWDRGSSLTVTAQTFVETLTDVQAANITDYTDLRLWFTGQNVSSTTPIVSWTELEVPVISYTLSAEAGSYVETGQIVTLKKNSKIIIDVNAYAIVGQVVNLYHGYGIVIEVGDYTLTGQTLNLLKGSKLSIEIGSYALTGQSINLLLGKRFFVDSGVYIITGEALSLLKGSRLSVESGSYILTGQSINFLLYVANKPLQKYATRLLVEMNLTDTHRFTSEDKYIEV